VGEVHSLPYADLDIILRWADDDGFRVDLAYNAPGDIEDYQYFGDKPIRFDLAELNALKSKTDAYGRRLGSLLFDGQGAVYLDRALRASKSMPVHVRLLVDPKAPRGYQAILWETLRHPGSGLRVTTNENIRFCRYQGSADGTSPAPLVRQGNLRALVAIANPADIDDYTDGPAIRLSAIDEAAEVKRARNALGDMSISVLPRDGARATRDNIVGSLRDGDFNAFYLVCHGELADEGPFLFLENEQGAVDRIDGTLLAEQVGDLTRVPTLAVLCSCQSGGPGAAAMTSTAESLTALGPALSRAGAAVVVAMQGNISMDTAARFLPLFFKELNRDGIAARAMAVARSAISDEPDWFMPVLYSRLKRGSAWYLPRFGGRETACFRKLHTRIAEKHCTPIIGSGVAAEDGILPTRQKCAEEWVKRRQMPISKNSQSDLASVAQYVSVDADRGVARDELRRFLRSYLKAAHSNDLPALDWNGGDLHALVRAVGTDKRQRSDRADSYSRLAALDLPVFVTSSWTNLLEDALVEEHKVPEPRTFDWYKGGISNVKDDIEFKPQQPLVYHLFGTLDIPSSLVLTEDDYFTWMRAWMKQVDAGVGIPHYVGPQLMDRSLMFLGYTFEDWEFRMIFQAIKSFEGNLLRDSSHVGVQLEPETLRVERESAQEYLESYLGADHLDVYWATCGRFLAELEETKPHDE
jgi:hypothetical protein